MEEVEEECLILPIVTLMKLTTSSYSLREASFTAPETDMPGLVILVFTINYLIHYPWQKSF